MKFTKEEIRKSMLLYAVTDRAWLKENETLVHIQCYMSIMHLI